MNLIILETGELDDSGDVTLSGVRAAHLLKVLKVKPAQTVRVGLLDGPFGIGTVTAVDNDTTTLRCVFEATIPSRPAVDLLLALPRPKVMRRLWAQIAALGVGRIMLTNAARVERNYFDAHVLDESTYRPLLIEGLQQARDTRLPVVSIHRQFRVLVEDELDVLFVDGLRLVADPAGHQTIAAATCDRRGSRVLIAVGPEGGWNDFELPLLESHGFGRISIGHRTLRADTACIALLAIAHDAISPAPHP